MHQLLRNLNYHRCSQNSHWSLVIGHSRSQVSSFPGSTWEQNLGGYTSRCARCEARLLGLVIYAFLEIGEVL